MKTSKRISALLLAVCLVMGMMVPVVFASGEVATKMVTYDFDYKGICDDNDLEWNTNSLADDRLLTNLSVYYNGSGTTTAGNDVEDAKYLNWNYRSDLVSEGVKTACDFMATGFFRARIASKDNYVVFEIDSPGAGDWLISADVFVSNRGAKQIDVYMLPITETSIADNLKTTIGFFDCSDSEQTTKDQPTKKINDCEVGTWENVEANTKYLLVLKVTEPYNNKYAQIYLSGLTMTQIYSDSNKAAAAMGEDGINTQITLEEDLSLQNAVTSAADVVVDAGVELDLNGNDLTASSVMIVKGGKVIDTAETAGQLTATLSASGDNGGYVPLKNSAGAYSFYKAEVNVNSAAGGKLKFQVKFDKDAGYDALAAESNNAEIGGAFAWTVTGGEAKTQAHGINYADGVTLAQKWGQMVKEKNYANGWIVLTFTGLDGFDALSVAPYIVSEGVTIQADAQTLKSAG